MPSGFRRALVALLSAFCVLTPPALSRAQGHANGSRFQLRVDPVLDTETSAPPAPPEPCTQDCWGLSHLSLRGAANGTLSFELRGYVRAREEQRIPLFGPPNQVRLEDVTIDGARATMTFDSDAYYVFTSSRAFTVRGKLTIGSDQMLSIPGPLMSLDAQLSKGRIVEGEKLSGLTSTVLHFDPMTEEEGAQPAKPKAPPVFRLSRALRFGHETSFVYRITSSHSEDLGTIRLPLSLGEKVKDVQGSTGWTVSGSTLELPTSGHEADVTISGTMAPPTPSVGPRTFGTDERSVYEWWMIESDPEHRVAVGGEGKLVATSQSPIPASTPNARVFLVQRGQRLEVDVRSLVRGDVLAAVARTHSSYVAITGSGELISDELVAFENKGLDHLMLTPAGKAMYLSSDHVPERILHTEAGSADVLLPIPVGAHQLRVQSLSKVKLWPFAGAVAIPSSSYPLATSASEITVGLPEDVHPIAVVGGDRARWAFSRADLVAAMLGVAFACFGFRTRRTRALGAVVTAGLWFVSREAFVFAAGGLFVAGAVFLASRFVRGTWLLAASGVALVVALFTGRFALQSDATVEPKYDMFVSNPSLPVPEQGTMGYDPNGRASADEKALTPVSLSFPTSERYVHATRQLVTSERPFTPRVLYVTSALVSVLHVAWLALLGLLGWMHRDRLLALKDRVVERLTRRPDAPPTDGLPDAAPPF